LLYLNVLIAPGEPLAILKVLNDSNHLLEGPIGANKLIGNIIIWKKDNGYLVPKSPIGR